MSTDDLTYSWSVKNIDPSYMSPVAALLEEIMRATEKHGIQDVPSFDAAVLTIPTGEDWRAEVRNRFYHIPSEQVAKDLTDQRFERGVGTWADIALEEVCEAFSARTENDLRAELIQAAAMFVAWAATLDRVGMNPPRETSTK